MRGKIQYLYNMLSNPPRACEDRQYKFTHPATLLMFFLLFFSTIYITPCAAGITYTGDGGYLQTPPSWTGITEDSLYPGDKTAPLSSDNRVIVDYDSSAAGNTAPENVFGGLGYLEDSANNSVSVVKGNINYAVFGGYSDSGDAAGNSVSIGEGTAIGSTVYGGYATARVSFSGNGGLSSNISAAGNSVAIESGDIGYSVYGGYTTAYVNFDGNDGLSSNVSAAGNSVAIKSSDIRGGVYGGDATARVAFRGNDGLYSIDVSAAGNSVAIESSDISCDIYGGRATASVQFFGNDGLSSNVSAAGNSVAIESSGISGDIYGGHANTHVSVNSDNDAYSSVSAAARNTVTISESKISGDVYGGAAKAVAFLHSAHDVYSSVSAAATGNSVVIESNDIAGSVYGGYVYVDASFRTNVYPSVSATAMGNSVAINSSDINDSVFGGFAAANAIVYPDHVGSSSVNVSAAGNNVVMESSEIREDVYGGYARVTDESSLPDSAAEATTSGNTVSITGGKVGGNIYGGHALVNAGAGTAASSASGNTVSIIGGKVTGNIYGGYAVANAAAGTAVSGAIDNTVNIIGAPVLSSSAIYGGYANNNGDAWSGNTLNMRNSETIYAKGVGNFEYYNFWLRAGTVNLDAMLSVTTNVSVDSSRAEVLLDGSSILESGDKVALIYTTGSMSGTTVNDSSQAKYGATVIYDFDIYTDADTLWAALREKRAAPESEGLIDSNLAPVAFLNQGADLIATLEYLEVSRDRKSRYTTFAAVTGGSSSYEVRSDSEIDVDGVSFIAGVMWHKEKSDGILQLRAFVEAGWGGYDTVGIFGAARSRVRGNGDMDYYGAGLYARYDKTKETPGGFYADASLRAGRIDYDFSTSDLKNNTGRNAGYGLSAAYFGAHGGAGYVWQLSDRTRLDLSSKLLWTHQNGDDFTLTTGDRVTFRSIDSLRSRTGFRVTRDYTEQFSLYYGAYYEYEFDGDADGRLYGIYDMDRASLSGSTGIGELGLIFRPESNDRFSAWLGIHGYVGAREGFSGKLKLQYNI